MSLKEKQAHLQTLEEFFIFVLKLGHTFWHCKEQDRETGIPFYYVNRNRTRNMSTCSHCYQLLALAKKIRVLQKDLGLRVWPLRNYITGDAAAFTVQEPHNEWNINRQYAAAHG